MHNLFIGWKSCLTFEFLRYIIAFHKGLSMYVINLVSRTGCRDLPQTNGVVQWFEDLASCHSTNSFNRQKISLRATISNYVREAGQIKIMRKHGGSPVFMVMTLRNLD